MEQLIAGAKFPAKCVKNEIHNLLTTLRLSRSRATYGQQVPSNSLRSLQKLFEELTYIHELHEFDTVAYLGPFVEVICSETTDAQTTAVALGAVDKFVSFGLVHPDSPRCMEAVNTLAWGVINCRFISSGSANDEVVLLKMVGVLISCLRCPAGEYLSDPCVWHMVRKCFQISRQSRSSHLLRSSAEGVLQQMVLTIFGTQKARAGRIRVCPPDADLGVVPDSATPAGLGEKLEGQAAGRQVQVYKPYGFRAMHFVLRFLAFLLAYGRSTPAAGPEAKPVRRVRKQRSRSPSCEKMPAPASPRDAAEPPGSSPETADLGLKGASANDREDLSTDTHCLGLSLLNVALESGGDEIARSEELIMVIQDDICKSLLQNSRTDSLSVLSLTLRAIFNLFLHCKRHLKVQLEIFFTSVHLKIACLDTASYEQREIALESLLEFCREPELMLELYENYDCDVRCTNLFETLVRFLVTNAKPVDVALSQQGQGARGSLHRLALSGLLSILHSMALRCEGLRSFRPIEGTGADCDSPGLQSPEGHAATGAATQLQLKKEQKRRLAIAARTFNAEPSKSMGALQSLGLVTNPITPESMAEFLRHTPSLDLRVVGEYLAKRKDFNAEVRHAFMALFPFASLGLTEALRVLLSTFRLPGESQLIERLMESFAEAYFTRQPIILEGADAATDGKPQDPLKTPRWVPREKHLDEAPDAEHGGGPEDAAGEEPMRVKMLCSDTIFVLSYSIIMLNTDLHSSKVSKKMSVEEYIRNNRGIDNGKDMPAFFLRDIYEAIRDDEIRLHGDAPADGSSVDHVVDDFFWEGILRRSESIDEFSTTERLLTETPPGATERDMLQVIMDCSPLPTLSASYETSNDPAVAMQAMTGFQDIARLHAYFDQKEVVNNLVRDVCHHFIKASIGGVLTKQAQISLRAAQECIVQHVLLFRDGEWRCALDVFVQLWALDLLPTHLTELDDFAGADGRPLDSRCALKPPFPKPLETDVADSNMTGAWEVEAERSLRPQETGDGFLESLTRWFEDETRDEDDPLDRRPSGGDDSYSLLSGGLSGAKGQEELPVASTNPGAVHQAVRSYVARRGLVEIFTPTFTGRLPPESWQALTKALVTLSRPAKWTFGAGAMSPGSSATSPTGEDGVAAEASPPSSAPWPPWHEVADPVFGLELLTNMTCMPLGPGQNISQIWPQVSTHFERLLQHVIGGGGASEEQFIERLIVNTLRLCIRLIGNAELVPQLLTLAQHLSRLPTDLFTAYSERIACGVLVLVKETEMPHSGLVAIFALLRRISECPSNMGSCVAGMECLNYWLGDDQVLSRVLSLQQFPELLVTLKAFASQASTPASATALCHLSNLVPQLARGARNVPEAHGQWQSLWVPTLHALAEIAKDGSQKSSAQAFVYLQRLLLERGTEMALPWEQVPFYVWKECLEQVLFPLLQVRRTHAANADADVDGARTASAAQLVCRVVLTHMPDWLRASPDGFPLVFLRLLHMLVSEASAPTPSREPLVETLKNLLLVISADPLFRELPSPNAGETFLEGVWGVVAPAFPSLQEEINAILCPDMAPVDSAGSAGSPQGIPVVP